MTVRSFEVRIARIREGRGRTLRELAMRARMRPALLSRLERGDLAYPTREMTHRLTIALDMTAEEIDIRTRGVISNPMQPSNTPREVLQLIARVRWNQQKVAGFRSLVDHL